MRRRRGFTVIEIIIVMAIFSIVLGVVIQIFVFTTRTQRRSRSVQEAYAQARVGVEAVVREVQNGTLDYAAMSEDGSGSGIPWYTNELFLRDSQGQLVAFFCVKHDPENPSGGTKGCEAGDAGRGQIFMCRGDANCTSETERWVPVTDTATDVVAWATWVGPADNPFLRDPGNPTQFLSSQQPWATVSAVVRPQPVAGSQPPDVRLQATVSSRLYQR